VAYYYKIVVQKALLSCQDLQNYVQKALSFLTGFADSMNKRTKDDGRWCYHLRVHPPPFPPSTVTIPNVDVEHSDGKEHKQTMNELKDLLEIALSRLYELESTRRNKAVDAEIVRAKIGVLKLKIKMVNLEREEDLASHLRMCSIPSMKHSYGKFPLMKPGECDCVHIGYSIVMEQIHY